MNKIVRRLTFNAALFLSAVLPTVAHAAGTITVAVANSTCNAMQKVGNLFEQRHGYRLIYQCKSSGLLAKGLKGGAITADIYISASKEWMDFMIEAGLIRQEQVTSPWGNELVVVAAANNPMKKLSWSDLAGPRINSILIGDPGNAPFGRYAKDAMQNTGIWDAARSKITTKMHITLLADAMTEADSATVGIMFRSNINTGHKILLNVDERWHEPIRYYVAPIAGATTNPGVIEFMQFLQDKEVRLIFNTEETVNQIV